MSDDNCPFLSFDCIDSEYTPDRVTQYLTFKVRLNGGVFSGGTEFVTTARALEHFVEELKEFYKSLNNSPELIAGWGEDLYFSLTFSKYGLRGNVLLECELKQRSTGTHFDSVHVYRNIELSRVDEIARSFEWVLKGEGVDTTTIAWM